MPHAACHMPYATCHGMRAALNNFDLKCAQAQLKAPQQQGVGGVAVRGAACDKFMRRRRAQEITWPTSLGSVVTMKTFSRGGSIE